MNNKKINIEALLLMAKYDESFKQKLFANRNEAMCESGLDFTPAEKMILENISDEQLKENINEFRVEGITKKSLTNWTKAAAVILLLTSLLLVDVDVEACIMGVKPGPRPPRKKIIKESDDKDNVIPPVRGTVPDVPRLKEQPLTPVEHFSPGPQPPPPPMGITPDPPIILVEFQKIYFDYDRSDITDKAKKVLAVNAKVLRNDTDKDILIEGHCDERGTEEYNLALGARRAEAVKKYLVSLGIDAKRLSTIAYGEVKPALDEHNESAWMLNRRVVLKEIKK